MGAASRRDRCAPGSEISLKRASRRRGNGQAGFAAVDALVALVILSSALGLSLVATQSARKVAAQAARTRRAEALCRYLLVTNTGVVGVTSGRSADLDWRLEVKPVSSDPRAPESGLCAAAAAVHAPGGGRIFVLSTVASCQRKAAT